MNRDIQPIQRYSLKERGRLIGSFSTAELRQMRDRNQLTRFHQVSQTGTQWERAMSLLERLEIQEQAAAIAASAPPPPIPIEAVIPYQPFPVWLLIALHYLTLGVFSFFWVTSLHGRLPRNSPDEPSGLRAVGLMLVPLVNLYWMFTCYPLLVTRLNRIRERRGLPADVLYFPALILCVLFLVVSLMAIAVGFVIFTLVMRQSSVGPQLTFMERSEHAIWFFILLPQLLTLVNFVFLAPQFSSMCQTAFNQIAASQETQLTRLLGNQ